jgi:hypothetical protein
MPLDALHTMLSCLTSNLVTRVIITNLKQANGASTEYHIVHATSTIECSDPCTSYRISGVVRRILHIPQVTKGTFRAYINHKTLANLQEELHTKLIS